MIQFNLLPDVKQQFVKARRLKHLVTLASIAAGGLAIFILLVLLVTVDIVQKKTLNDLNRDIKANFSTLSAVPDINRVLTVQNQLTTLTSLHDQKVATSQLFTYISQVTPTPASISKLSADFTQNTASITGEALTLDVVNTYVDTLKATTYKNSTDTDGKTKAFSDVVLSTFGRDSKGATFTITLSFDPIIFSGTDKATLTVPKGATGAQAQLFQNQAGN